MDAAEQEVLDRFRALVSQRVPVREMVLFGSRARGDADAASDMDILVVLADSAPADAPDQVSDAAWEAGYPRGIVIVPVVFRRHEWEDGPERHSLLADAIRAEGVPL